MQRRLSAVPPLKTYHFIPHTHWDREWYLSFDHFRVMLVHLMDDLLDLLAERADYAGFLLDGQTVVAEDYLAIRPDRREELTRYVAADRLWMGPWYVLPDTFLVSGEAIVRNLMRGRAQAQSFGRSMDVGYIPDSFGHTAQLPQILRGFGIDNAIVWRGFGGEPGQEPSEYRWRSPDGSEVLMEHLSALGYSGGYFTQLEPDELARRFAAFRSYVEARARTTEVLMLSGGDHHWPYAHVPEVIAELNGSSDDGVRVVHSSLGRFMEAMKQAAQEADLTTVEGELRFGYRWAYNVTGGVYSSRMHLKQANARCQRLLERYLEPMNARSVLAGGRSQHSLLEQGWTYLLQNHPHDSICGCSIDLVHREMETRFAKLEELGRGVERFAWMNLAPDLEGAASDDRTIVVFNPSPHTRDEVLETDVRFFRQQVVVGLNPDVVPAPPLDPVAGFTIEDAEGEPVSFEVLERAEDYGLALNRFDYPAQSRVERFRVRVDANRLPPLGLRAYHIRRRNAFPSAPTAGGLTVDARVLENEHLRVEVREDGAFFVLERETGNRFGPVNYFEDGADAGDVYNYSPPPADRVLASLGTASVTTEPVPGALRAGIRMRGRWDLPRALANDLSRRTDETVPVSITTTASLTPNSRHVSFETVVDNRARDHRLRVLFETGCRTNVHHADNAFAILTREQIAYDSADFEIEVPAAVAPMHRFVSVEDETRGVTVLADGLPEYELKHDSGGIVALTLLRCVGELGRANLKMRPAGQGAWHNETPEAQCLGIHHFRYAVLPHGSGWAEHAGVINRAAESFLLPPRTTVLRRADVSVDELPFLSVEPDALVLSALKEAQDGTAWVLRVYNPTSIPVDGRLSFSRPLRIVHEADLEEHRQSEVKPKGNEIRNRWLPFAIHTYRFEFGS